MTSTGLLLPTSASKLFLTRKSLYRVRVPMMKSLAIRSAMRSIVTNPRELPVSFPVRRPRRLMCGTFLRISLPCRLSTLRSLKTIRQLIELSRCHQNLISSWICGFPLLPIGQCPSIVFLDLSIISDICSEDVLWSHFNFWSVDYGPRSRLFGR